MVCLKCDFVRERNNMLDIKMQVIKWPSFYMCTSPEGWNFCFWMSAAVTLKDAISSVIYSSPSRLYQDKL